VSCWFVDSIVTQHSVLACVDAGGQVTRLAVLTMGVNVLGTPFSYHYGQKTEPVPTFKMIILNFVQC